MEVPALMVTGSGQGGVVLLDCCSLLNLYATRRMSEIIAALPLRFAVAAYVAGEASYVLRGGDGDDAEEREPVDLQPLIAAGLLEVWRPEVDDEFTSFVNFAAEIDDGEAVTCALALHRGAAVVTDDRKALRTLLLRAPQVPALTTSQVLKLWADSCQVERAMLRAVLIDVQRRARFFPGKQDPLLAWWEAAVTHE